MSFSIVILTHDEEANLPRCLDAIQWCDDVVVVDSYSSDRTVAIAKERGARVVQNPFKDFGQQRTFAMEHVEYKHEWVFHLDADEVFTPELRVEVDQAIQIDRYEAYWVPSKLMFLNQWLKYAGMYPVYQVRLGRKGLLRYERFGHTQRSTIGEGRTGRLTEAYLHYNFSKGLADWFGKHNRYSTAEAEEQLLAGEVPGLDVAGIFAVSDPVRRRQALKKLSKRLPFRPLLRFLYVYVLCRGFLDGRAGWAYSWMLAYYEFMISVKILERRLR